MRLWTFLSIFLFVHVLALAGLVGFLKATDRLNRERAEAVVDLFRPTITDEKATRESQDAMNTAAASRADEEAHWTAVADGPQQVESRLDDDAQAAEVRRQALERQERMLKDLASQLAREKQVLAREKESLATAQADFEKAMEERTAKLRDEDFQLARKMYEQLKAKQAKEMFQELMKTGRTDQVVDYLAAMQQRKAAAVLKEFKQPVEIIQATQLVQLLRSRGIDLMPDEFQEDNAT